MSVAEVFHEIAQYDTSLKDWERRIIMGEPLIPQGLPMFEEGRRALAIFKKLRVSDIPGKPTMGECMPQWVFDFVGVIFGSYDATIRRRLISDFFLLIAKKNGKSTIAAGIMLTALMLAKRDMDLYMILAPTKEVADNSFLPAYGMIKNDPVLIEMFKPNKITRTIERYKLENLLAVKAADAETVGGQKPTASLIDEVWLFGKMNGAENIFSEVIGARASRPEGFTVYLTTQSNERPLGVFKEKLRYHRKVRDGEIVDPTSFQMLFEFPIAMQEDEEWRDLRNAYITNPSLGKSVDMPFLEKKFREAEENGIEAVKLFAAKHLNVEIGVGLRSDRWPGVEDWDQRADPTLTLDSLIERSEVVVLAADGGGLDDIFGFVAMGREYETRRWLIWSHGFAHKGVLERRKIIANQLREFEKAGELTIVNNELDDIVRIIGFVEKVKESGKLACFAVDPAGLGELVDELSKIEVTEESGLLVGVKQGMGLMNALKTTERKVTNGTIVHSGSSLMKWCCENLKIEAMATAIRATKQNAGDKKIDVAMAMFDAASVMVLNPQPQGLPEIYIL